VVNNDAPAHEAGASRLEVGTHYACLYRCIGHKKPVIGSRNNCAGKTLAALGMCSFVNAQLVIAEKPALFHIKNKVQLIGYLGKNPEHKTAKKTGRTFAILSLATQSAWISKLRNVGEKKTRTAER
jgi:hypothetical protein